MSSLPPVYLNISNRDECAMNLLADFVQPEQGKFREFTFQAFG
jgi:hypothetical protein